AEAAQFLGCSRTHLLKLAREGQVPAHPLSSGETKRRRIWRFRLSELEAFMLNGVTPAPSRVGLPANKAGRAREGALCDSALRRRRAYGRIRGRRPGDTRHIGILRFACRGITFSVEYRRGLSSGEI